MKKIIVIFCLFLSLSACTDSASGDCFGLKLGMSKARALSVLEKPIREKKIICTYFDREDGLSYRRAKYMGVEFEQFLLHFDTSGKLDKIVFFTSAEYDFGMLDIFDQLLINLTSEYGEPLLFESDKGEDHTFYYSWQLKKRVVKLYFSVDEYLTYPLFLAYTKEI